MYHFFDPNESRTETELKRAVDAKTQARFAYLRMEIAIYHNTSDEKRKENGGLSYWRLIDSKLAQLCDKSRDYLRAFNAIILARDQGLFDGKNKWDEIKSNEKFQIPTKEDVHMAIRTLPAAG
ncbi:uncharacterized protein MELLADRAFT_73013 [Melampsora larici-populina 98AG31]|uniref:Uncharacterized protein n=1 Tax=Melampsora larici-populina (strain 98AG31 / pathotype 3-4-7) TaxID=747676 RepID=F4S207_MELLP|nr:uncharacterized protein MELLADRAFT_73013 [Melampsora larici-populina 98AG31]EGG01346.1 hypothetical protein MELLADRAFT_73013 [Melampsora larici-populina 98AG31]